MFLKSAEHDKYEINDLASEEITDLPVDPRDRELRTQSVPGPSRKVDTLTD
jgi:hypothetical protein